MRVEPSSITACGKTQRPTPLGLAHLGCGLADESTGYGASQDASCGRQEGPTGEGRGYRLTRDVDHCCISFTEGSETPALRSSVSGREHKVSIKICVGEHEVVRRVYPIILSPNTPGLRACGQRRPANCGQISVYKSRRR